MRRQQEQEHKLVLRHRWYAGIVATLVSGAMMIVGYVPAFADDAVPSPAPSSSSATGGAGGDAGDAGTAGGSGGTDAGSSDAGSGSDTGAASDTGAKGTSDAKGASGAKGSTDAKGTSDAKTDTTTPPSSDANGDQPSPEASTPASDDTSGTDAGKTDAKNDGSTTAPKQLTSKGVTVAPLASEKKTVTITVNVGGIRQTNSVSGLAGATVTATSGNNSATCLSDSNGTCKLSGLPTGYKWNISIMAVPTPGWFANSELATGGTPSQTTYRFRTDTVNSDTTVPGTGTTNYDDAGGTFSNMLAASLANPQAPKQCGISIAMVLDQSGSMGDDNKQANLKSAAKEAVNALVGTPSSVAIYTFGTTDDSQGHQASTSTATTASAAPLISFINGLPAGNQLNSATNWDRGLSQVPAGFDLVLFVTDGAPTVWGTSSTSGGNTSFQDIENGIFSANKVKSQNGATAGHKERIVGLGIGLGDAAVNLASVTGPTPGVDYFTATAGGFGDVLKDLATGNCQNALTIHKQIETVDGTVLADSADANGWSYGLSTTQGTLGDASVTTSQQSGQNGFASTTFTATATATPTISVTEHLKSGYTIDTDKTLCLVDGKKATISWSGTTASFSGKPGVSMSCTFVNKVIPRQNLTVTATATPSYDRDYDWTISKDVDRTSAEVVPGHDATFHYTVTATKSAAKDSHFVVAGTITVTNPNNVAVPLTGISDTIPGATCTITGSTTVPANGHIDVAYTCTMPASTAATSTGTSTATVTWAKTDFPGTTGSATATAGYDFASVTPTTTDDTATVGDSATEFGGDRTIDKTTTFPYTVDFGKDVPAGQCDTYDNTATLTPSDSAATTAKQSVKVCAGADLTVSKTVVSSLTRTYAWSLDKQVDKTTATANDDGTATFHYTVTATPGAYTDSLWAMSGTITVANPNAWDVTATVTDAPDIGGGVQCTVTDGVDVVIPGNGSKTFHYSCTFTSAPHLTGTNVATVTWDATAAHTANSSATGNADITASTWTTTPVNDTVTVVDDKTDPDNPVDLGTATWNAEHTATTFTYDLTLPAASGTCTDYTNTANLNQLPGTTAEQKVTVCNYSDLTVTTTAAPSFVRDYTYSIDKTAAATRLIADPNTGKATADYTVTVTDGATVDSQFAVTGTITVHNPNDAAVELTGVTDAITDATCTIQSAARTVPAGGDLTLGYTCTMPDGTTAATTGTDQVTVTWDASGLPGSDGTATAAQGFDFAHATITDGVSKTVTVVDDMTNPTANPLPQLGTHTWTKLGATQTYTYTLTLDGGTAGQCTDYTNHASIRETQQGASEKVSVCTPTGTVDKTVDSVAQNADGTWTVVYGLTVTNPSPTVELRYDLRDTFDFGAGFTVTGTPQITAPAGVTTRPDWNGSTQPVIASNVALPGGDGPHHYTVTVRVAFEKTTTNPGLVCQDGTAGAFGNVDALYRTGATTPLDTAHACAEPGSPTVTKTAQDAHQNADGSWTIGYTVDVHNTTGTTLAYTVTDAAAPLPAGVTGGAWQASGPDAVPAGDVATLADGWNGSGTLATGLISAGATHTYTVTRTVTVGTTVSEASLVCGDDHTTGIWNTATVSNGIGGDSSSDCATVHTADVALAKTVTSVSQAADGTWTVVYDLTATNTSSSWIARYDLTDTLAFGGDITDVAASFTGAATGTFTGDSATLATGRVLSAGATDTYTVTVTATVPPAAWQGDTLACEPGDQPGAGGFLNTAQLLAGGHTADADACDTPTRPTVSKTGVSAVQNPDDADQWTVTYDITVDNTAGKATVYSLSDTPHFAAGVAVTGGTATGPGISGTGVAITAGDDFATDVALPAGAVHTYTVTWTVRLGDDYSAQNEQCTGRSGHGFFNTATMTVGGDATDTSACIPVTERVYPTVAKTATSATQGDDGSWTIVYDVTATLAPTGDANPAGLSASYDLTDTLAFGAGIHVTAATWSGASSGTYSGDTATFAHDRTIKPGATDTYTVTVVATVAQSAIDGQTTRCAAGGGFVNTAALTSGGQTQDASACAEPQFPSVSKAPASTVRNADGTQTVSYLVTVAVPAHNAVPTDIAYTLNDTPDALPTGVTLAGDKAWHATATGGAPAPQTPTWDGTGPWTIASGVFTAADIARGDTARSYRVSVTVDVAAAHAESTRCAPAEADGIVLWNTATVASGAYSDDDRACNVVHVVDLGIVKTASTAGPVDDDPGATSRFAYTLRVTNHGDQDVTDATVTDPLPSLVELDTAAGTDGLELPAGWTATVTGGRIVVTIPELAAGASDDIVVHVLVTPVVRVATVVDPGVAGPADMLPPSSIENTACVAVANDVDASNDCSTVTVPQKAVEANIWVQCTADVPSLHYSIRTTENIAGDPVSLVWAASAPGQNGVPVTDLPADPASVSRQLHDGDSGSILWPGGAVNAQGVGIGFPGWRPLTAADYNADGTLAFPSSQVFAGLVYDPATVATDAWRYGSTVTVSVNPTTTYTVSFPPSTEACAVKRPTDLTIGKTASVTHTAPGGSFDYRIDVANVALGAASPVTITDPIPAEVKVDQISTSTTAFPQWQDCQVTGRDAAGYGGTLTCSLFGPLMLDSAAPTITLHVTVDPSTTVKAVTNTATVDWKNFDDPDQTGTASSSVTVAVTQPDIELPLTDGTPVLPLTGGTPMFPLLPFGILVILAGGLLLSTRRRRRGPAQS
ncbi:LPXTG cell wall anchor domain-containing protein [Microbacterium luticocti]|uniref:LPXTG cell wall anchor domain-containing protein n=1 Tax=Microbacterium luticocti TaxID=451764 RepID=UPI00040ECE0B|nr:LPXTG cell wall anchor domain-containing protein [Microbacterium luticocti]